MWDLIGLAQSHSPADGQMAHDLCWSVRVILILNPSRGPKGRGVAPMGATRGVH